MKRILLFMSIAAAVAFTSPSEREQEPQQADVAELFRTMPDSLLPLLTHNDRLDLLDFHRAGMKAEVTNRLEGITTMTALTQDSLSVKLDTVLRADITLRTLGDSLVIAFRQTYTIGSGSEESFVTFYSTSWLPLPIATEETSTLLRRDTIARGRLKIED